MATEFGVLLPTRESVMSGRMETAPLLAMAERAEAAGFDSVWIGDSLTARPRHANPEDGSLRHTGLGRDRHEGD